MTLGPFYYQADDGKWYDHLSIGEDDWFVVFDDDDEPELVIKSSSPITAPEILARLPMFKLPDNFAAKDRQGMRHRMQGGFGKMVDVRYYRLPEPSGPVPASLIREHDGVLEAKTCAACEREIPLFTGYISTPKGELHNKCWRKKGVSNAR